MSKALAKNTAADQPDTHKRVTLPYRSGGGGGRLVSSLTTINDGAVMVVHPSKEIEDFMKDWKMAEIAVDQDENGKVDAIHLAKSEDNYRIRLSKYGRKSVHIPVTAIGKLDVNGTSRAPCESHVEGDSICFSLPESWSLRRSA